MAMSADMLTLQRLQQIYKFVADPELRFKWNREFLGDAVDQQLADDVLKAVALGTAITETLEMVEVLRVLVEKDLVAGPPMHGQIMGVLLPKLCIN